MTRLGIIPFLEHPLENWIFVIAVALIAVGIKLFLFIRSRQKPYVPPQRRPDDEINPWEEFEKGKKENK